MRTTKFILFFFLTAIFVRCGQPEPGNRQPIGYLHCMPVTEAVTIIPSDTKTRQAFISCCLTDSTHHFFQKTIVVDQKDTFYLSTFTKGVLSDYLETLRKNGGSLLERKNSAINQLWFLRKGDRFISRWFFPETEFNSLIILDYASADSLAARTIFQKDPLQSLVGKCR